MDVEQRKHIFSSMMIFRRRKRQKSRINISELKNQDQILSQIESHFPSQFKNQSQRYNPLITTCPERKHLLQIIKHVHLELCKLSKTICTILGVQVACEIGLIIMYLSGAFYNLFIRYVMHQHKVKGVPAQTALTLSLSFLNIFRAVFVSRICKYAADEGNKTIEIIHAIYGCDTDIDMQEEIQQFGIQILQSPVTFSAFGLTLDNRILTMILKSVTIYVVIMVQVSITLESDNAVQDSLLGNFTFEVIFYANSGLNNVMLHLWLIVEEGILRDGSIEAIIPARENFEV
ncbi:PREDICTED: uncharacterized protein LOC105143638 [Acromyrmex echinatior]|uniref:uncharacterized protein LOC105143638 n=1 Tax=Acromyrmex echinatior TaxID=103372 RepID=UPI000580E575|nr:PREDICTED: uncharacterized protein LOC105143638 [Acromyrmex echinatior]